MVEVAVPLLIMPESAMCDAKHRTGRAGGEYHHTGIANISTRSSQNKPHETLSLCDPAMEKQVH